MHTLVESCTAFFTDIPANQSRGGFLCRVAAAPGARWLLMSGTISRDPNNAEQVHFRVEVQRPDPAGGYATLWTRDVNRTLAPGQQHFVLNMMSERVTALPADDLFVRVTMLGSAVLLPDDGFFVVAIDTDDDPGANAYRHRTGVDDTANVPKY